MSKVEMDRKENIKLSQGLTKENDKIFTDIVCYLRVSDISEKDQEEIISDILGMFLGWQEQGKSIESMVGEDYKKFTENIILAVNPKKSSFKKIRENLGIAVEGFFTLFTIDFIFGYLPKLVKGNLNLRYDYQLGMLINFLIIITLGFAIVNYICKNSFELSKQPSSKLHNFIFGAAYVGLIILLVFISRSFKNIVIISMNIRYAIGIIVVFWVYKIVRKAIK